MGKKQSKSTNRNKSANEYYVEGTIVEVCLELERKDGCWFKLKPSMNFIRKDGESEKVLIMSGKDAVIQPLKDFEARQFEVANAIAQTLLCVKVNHVTVRLAFADKKCGSVQSVVIG